MRIWADYDHATQRIIAFQTHLGAYENRRTIYLDGRAASAGARGAHVPGLLDRRVGRQHAHHHHHAPQGELPAPQRPPAQREGAPDRALEPARPVSDDRERARGSGRPDRAARPQPDVVLRPGAASGPLPVRVRARSARAARHRAASPAWGQPEPEGVPGLVRTCRAEAARGGAETLYPEFRSKIDSRYKPKDRCERFCNCVGFVGCLNPVTAHTPARSARRLMRRLLLAGAGCMAAAALVSAQQAPVTPPASARAEERAHAGGRRLATPWCRSATMACWWWTASRPPRRSRFARPSRRCRPKPIHTIISTHVHRGSRRRRRRAGEAAGHGRDAASPGDGARGRARSPAEGRGRSRSARRGPCASTR